MAGTDVFGDPSDSTQPWGIKFDHLAFDQILFTTNNIQHFTILPSSTFISGTWINGEMVPNHRSSLNPDAPGTSQVYYRQNGADDPHVSLTSSSVDMLYRADSITGSDQMLQAPFGGVSVWIRQSTSSPDDDKCLHPVTICFFDSKSIMRVNIEYS